MTRPFQITCREKRKGMLRFPLNRLIWTVSGHFYKAVDKLVVTGPCQIHRSAFIYRNSYIKAPGVKKYFIHSNLQGVHSTQFNSVVLVFIAMSKKKWRRIIFLLFFFSEDIFRFLKKLLKNNQDSNFPIKGENWEDEGNSFFNLKDCENTFPMGIQDPNPKTCKFHYKRKIKVVIIYCKSNTIKCFSIYFHDVF